jgi:hypothetical protein
MRTFTRWHRAALATLAVSSLAPCLAQPTSPAPSGPAAFLFAYHPKPGMEQLFAEGYRRHLSWHREKKDALVWYAWSVVTGARSGLFIDGTFGASFAGLDARPEPQADAADFAQTSAPFSEPAFRSVYRLRADLSTGQPLEERRPSPLVEVTHYVLRPGMESRFEGVLVKLRAALAASDEEPVRTWYELVVGGEHPSYMLMVPRRAWGDYDAAPEPIAALLERAHGPGAAQGLLTDLAASVAEARSETWGYRQDLSYFPRSE